MKYEEAKEKYEELFNNIESKAKAFDKIAEKYYFSNFGSTTKSDFDVLMFSIYIEQILDKEQSNMQAYSDYTLSKQLGITQSKISNLKVKKELAYPYNGFKWQDSFIEISKNAVFEDNKIKIFIPDRNLYLEIKNAIECAGGFIEVQLTANLLQVRLEYFLDLITAIDDEKMRAVHRKEIQKRIKEQDKDISIIEKAPIGKTLINKTPELIIEIISQCIPVFGGVAKSVAMNLLEIIKQGREVKT